MTAIAAALAVLSTTYENVRRFDPTRYAGLSFFTEVIEAAVFTALGTGRALLGWPCRDTDAILFKERMCDSQARHRRESEYKDTVLHFN